MSDTPDITLDQALAVIAKHEAGKQRTYEDGLKDGEARASTAAQENAEKTVAPIRAGLEKALARAKDFADVHGRSQAGRAFNQIAADIQKIIGNGK